MVKVISSDEDFTEWLQGFLPQLFDPEFSLPAGEVKDRAGRGEFLPSLVSLQHRRQTGED